MFVALAPGMQFTMVTGVAKFTFLTRVISTGFTAVALLGVGNLLETWVVGAMVALDFDYVPEL